MRDVPQDEDREHAQATGLAMSGLRCLALTLLRLLVPAPYIPDAQRLVATMPDNGTEARPFRGGRRSRTPAIGRKDGEKLRNTHDVNAISLAHRDLEFFVPFEVIISGH